MSNRFNSHKHKKFNRYTASASAKKRSFSPYLIILLSAVAAIIAALLLGTFLGELADTAPKPDEDTKNDPSPELPSLLDAEEIKGCFVTLDGIFDNTTQNVRDQLPDDATAASLMLFDANGDPYYRSEITEAFGNKCGELTLSRVFDGLTVGDRMIYSSVIFPSVAINNKEAAKQAVMNAYEAALIEELSKAGAQDVVITPFAFGDEGYKIDENFVIKLEGYVASLRSLSPELRIGLSLPLEYLSDTKHSVLLEELAKRVDFLALDLTAYTDLESFSDAISAASLNVLRRNVRLLLCQTSEEEILHLTTLLDKYSMTNYQVVSKLK